MIRDTLLVVDDAEVNRILIKRLFQEDFLIEEATNGVEAIDVITRMNGRIAAVLLDIVMPELDGKGVVDFMAKNTYMQHIPVILITVRQDAKLISWANTVGVSGFIAKPFNPMIVRHRVKNAVDVYREKNKLEEEIAGQKRLIAEQNEHLLHVGEAAANMLGTAIQYKLDEKRSCAADIARLLLNEYRRLNPHFGLNDSDIRAISTACELRDIGMLELPDSILLTTDALTDEEYEAVKRHTLSDKAAIMDLCDGSTELCELYAEVCRSHHERFDGKGYPDGLSGDAIPFSAQVAGITDAYCALTSSRPYRAAYAPQLAAEMVLSGRCGAFSRPLLDCFESVLPRIMLLMSD